MDDQTDIAPWLSLEQLERFAEAADESETEQALQESLGELGEDLNAEQFDIWKHSMVRLERARATQAEIRQKLLDQAGASPATWDRLARLACEAIAGLVNENVLPEGARKVLRTRLSTHSPGPRRRTKGQREFPARPDSGIPATRLC